MLDPGLIGKPLVILVPFLTGIVGCHQTPGRPLLGESASGATFLMLQGTDTIAVEKVQRSAGALTGNVVLRNVGRYMYVASIDSGESMSRMEAAFFGPDTTRPRQHVRVTVSDGSARVERSTDGTADTSDIDVTLAPAIYVNPSAALLEQIIRRGRVLRSGSMPDVAVPVVLATQAQATIAQVTFHSEDSVSVRIGPTEIQVRLGPGGRLQTGSAASQRLSIIRVPEH